MLLTDISLQNGFHALLFVAGNWAWLWNGDFLWGRARGRDWTLAAEMWAFFRDAGDHPWRFYGMIRHARPIEAKMQIVRLVESCALPLGRRESGSRMLFVVCVATGAFAPFRGLRTAGLYF